MTGHRNTAAPVSRDEHHSVSILKLLTTRRFLPLFATQFLGAFNDNVFRQAVAVMILFDIAAAGGVDGQVLVPLAAGLFVLPYFLFSAVAGQLADKLDKARLIRIVKFTEILCMGLAAIGFVVADPYLLLGVVFLMGAQSTFFGPAKYAILPDHLAEEEVVAANAAIEAGTFAAILLGTLSGIFLVRGEIGHEVVAVSVVAIAAIGFAVSCLIPPTDAAAPETKLNYNIFGETWRIMRHAAERTDVFRSILGISWFWLVGVTFISMFTAYAKDVAGGNEEVVAVFMTAFVIGIASGSVLCNTLMKGEVSARYVPIGALGMAVFTLDLALATNGATPVSAAASTIGAAEFVADPGNLRILGDLLLISLFSGLFTVPLYVIVQERSDRASRSRTIAGNNVVNALFMVAGSAASAALLELGFGVPDIFLILAIGTVLVALYVVKLLPAELVLTLAAWIFRIAYRVEIRGIENLKNAKGNTVVVANHTSFLDAALIAAFLPVRGPFAIDTNMAKKWWVRPVLGLVETFSVDPTNPMATKSLIGAVKEQGQCVIFPEGRLTVTGRLMKVYEGPALVADKSAAEIVPIHIEGAQYTHFTRLRGKLRRRLFPKITITVLPPRKLAIDGEIKGRARRRALGRELYDVMSDLVFEASARDRTIFDALLDAAATHGPGKTIIEDVEAGAMSYRRLLRGSDMLGRRLAKTTSQGEAVGVLLPNSAATAAAFFALMRTGRVPAMLNFTAGPASLAAACRAAEVRTVVTSRRFVDAAKLAEAIEAIAREAAVIYLEDIRAGIGVADLLAAYLRAPFARWLHRALAVDPNSPAAILFTSGSEGTPKGVVLSHANILANVRQATARVDFTPQDKVFNALPVFHSFGLTGGLIIPALSGTSVFMYPSPLHYRIVPELAYVSNATILFGTDTFLSGYARAADPYDFYAIRYVFAGAERVRDETRRVWMEKFGVRIMEGYGATECAPVIAINTPMHFKAGTVGRFLPGIEHRLDPVPGIDDGGRLYVAGPNVMLGYYFAEAPGVLQPPEDGWHDTGDIVTIDGDGFITIKGRAKRFAKIAGEMISLPAVEAMAHEIWPDATNAVVAIPDGRKGEQLVLLTTESKAERGALQSHAKKTGATELMVPRKVVAVERIPLLGTGKIDYPAATKLAGEQHD